MPIESSALVSGRESLSLEVVAGFESVAIGPAEESRRH